MTASVLQMVSQLQVWPSILHSELQSLASHYSHSSKSAANASNFLQSTFSWYPHHIFVSDLAVDSPGKSLFALIDHSLSSPNFINSQFLDASFVLCCNFKNSLFQNWVRISNRIRFFFLMARKFDGRELLATTGSYSTHLLGYLSVFYSLFHDVVFFLAVSDFWVVHYEYPASYLSPLVANTWPFANERISLWLLQTFCAIYTFLFLIM